MKTTALSVVALLVALAQVGAAADSEPKPCTVHDCMHSYDLSPLSAEKDYVFTSYNKRNFTLNICKGVVSDVWNPDVDNAQDIGGFFRGDHGDISIGKTNTTLHVRDGHPVLLMTDGSRCPHSESMRVSTAIRFICDPHDEGKPELIAQLPPEDENACAYFIEWRTKHACAVPDRYAYWKTAIMLIVIILAFILTGAALFALHKLIKRRRSTEAFLPMEREGPWYAVITPSALAERARDLGRHLTGQDPWGHPPGSREPSAGGGRGWGFKWRPSFGGRGRRDRRNFARLPRNAEEEAMMGSNGGPFSLDDDEDEDEDAHQGNGHAALNGDDAFAEESAAWGSARPRGMDGAGVIRL